jgi:chromate transporter
MTDRQFADMFGIAQVSPGPNVIIVTLIGYHVAGIAGAVVASLAMTGPTCIVAFLVGRVWERFKTAHWRIAIQAGLVPVSLGLMAASAYVIARATDQNWVSAVLTLATAALAYFTKINPLWMFVPAGLLGLTGWL